jgi:hypothetical protein
MADTYKPGDKVPKSGIYRVVHDGAHAGEHEVTCIYRKHFPPCNDCDDDVRFELVRAAKHVAKHKHFS